jgi:four helix bundle protein
MNDLRARTKRFALDVIRFCERLPNKPTCWIISKQLMRSATSVGANYRAACHAQSRATFIAKLAIVEEEADESQFWLELLRDLDVGDAKQRAYLYAEARELTAIIVASRKTAKRNR